MRSTPTGGNCAAKPIRALEPQVFDLLAYLIEKRDRVVSKDDLLASIWHGRNVSESTVTSRINAARGAIGDSGDRQRLIKTFLRKGIRFVGEVREQIQTTVPGTQTPPPVLGLPDRPSIAVLPFTNMTGDSSRNISVMALRKTSSPSCPDSANSS
jgi:DNA-binding winged helix-turn-helix (wHTH) protein